MPEAVGLQRLLHHKCWLELTQVKNGKEHAQAPYSPNVDFMQSFFLTFLQDSLSIKRVCYSCHGNSQTAT